LVAATKVPALAARPIESKLEAAKMRLIRIVLVVAALVLPACNAKKEVNLSSHCAGAADCNPYDPSSYAQNQTGRGGR
jgi:hypothetical protein